jgi:hypothetical protein
VYSDGSKLDSGNAGGGYAAFQNSHKIAEASLSYGKNAEVFDAEARAAVARISDILSRSTSNNAAIFGSASTTNSPGSISEPSKCLADFKCFRGLVIGNNP